MKCLRWRATRWADRKHRQRRVLCNRKVTGGGTCNLRVIELFFGVYLLAYSGSVIDEAIFSQRESFHEPLIQYFIDQPPFMDELASVQFQEGFALDNLG